MSRDDGATSQIPALLKLILNRIMYYFQILFEVALQHTLLSQLLPIVNSNAIFVRYCCFWVLRIYLMFGNCQKKVWNLYDRLNNSVLKENSVSQNCQTHSYASGFNATPGSPSCVFFVLTAQQCVLFTVFLFITRLSAFDDHNKQYTLHGPRREKLYLRGFLPSGAQTTETRSSFT